MVKLIHRSYSYLSVISSFLPFSSSTPPPPLFPHTPTPIPPPHIPGTSAINECLNPLTTAVASWHQAPLKTDICPCIKAKQTPNLYEFYSPRQAKICHGISNRYISKSKLTALCVTVLQSASTAYAYCNYPPLDSQS